MKKTLTESVIETLSLAKLGAIDVDPLMLEAEFDALLEICNGCGAKGSKLPIPQTNYGMDMRPACNPHDFGYAIGQNIEDKMREDRRMLNNSLRLIHLRSKNKFMRWLRTKRAIKYYLAVDLAGGPAFWDGKQ